LHRGHAHGQIAMQIEEMTMSRLLRRIRRRRRVSTTQMPDRDEFLRVASSPEVPACVEQMLAQIPPDDDFEPFAELKARRNQHGIVPVKE